MQRTSISLGLALALAAGWAAGQPGNGTDSRPSRPEPPKWPRLSPAQRDLAEGKLKVLCGTNGEKGAAAAETLKALGPGVAPLLLEALSDLKPERTGPLAAVLAAVTGPEHQPLLVPGLLHRFKEVRRTTLGLLLRAPGPALAPPLLEAWEQEKDEGLKTGLGLALCRLGETRALPALHELACKDFQGSRAEILEAAAGVKGEEATAWLLARLAQPDLAGKMAALRLLAAAGTRSAVPALGPYLAHDNHPIKAETVNALRAIVEGKPPLKHISVFDMIRLEQEWRERLGRQGKEKRP